MTTLEYDTRDLMWLLTAVGNDPDLWLKFKLQHNSDIYFINLDVMDWVKIQMKLSEIRRTINSAINHAALLKVTDQQDDLQPIAQSITVTINKVGELF